ncbi:MAG: transglycosylase SLT domain-containing protein [Campylobacterales bacterium]|nr:transglycosylase SLT domain-containing protein [Campylobacterales bacterium]
MKFILFLLFPILLVANLTYTTNHTKELEILEAFDIESSFLYDTAMNEMRSNHTAVDRDKEFFQAMEDAYLFIPAVKNLLSEYEIPQEFLYLAMAESNFHTKALSVKKASGFWQFMTETGQNYNLKVNEYVDERRDLIKSTKAASKHLARFDEKKKYIPEESRGYIRKIIALAFIGNDEQFMLKSEYEYLLNRANAYSISTVTLPMGESLSRVATLIGIPLEELKKLNRHLNYDFMPPYESSYDIYIPYIKLSEFKQKYHEEPISNIYKVHLVCAGDSLASLGRKYSISYKAIRDFNSIKGTHLTLNAKLIIPIQKSDEKQLSKKKAPLKLAIS